MFNVQHTFEYLIITSLRNLIIFYVSSSVVLFIERKKQNKNLIHTSKTGIIPCTMFNESGVKTN